MVDLRRNPFQKIRRNLVFEDHRQRQVDPLGPGAGLSAQLIAQAPHPADGNRLLRHGWAIDCEAEFCRRGGPVPVAILQHDCALLRVWNCLLKRRLDLF